MLTITLDKRYRNGRLMKFKVRSMRNEYGTGQTWHVIFESGETLNTLHSSRGKDRFTKKQIIFEYKKGVV